MSADKLKVLFVGLGGAGQRHLRVLKSILGDNVALSAYRVRGNTAVISPTYALDTTESVEKKYGITVFKNLDDAIAESPDVAIISNPSSLHMKAALPLARAGVHMFIEKPLSDSWDGVDELIEIAEKKKLSIGLAYQLRFHPCLQWIEEQLSQNRIGRVMAADVRVNSFLPGLHPYENFLDTYIARKELGGGVILTEIHEIDTAFRFFGTPARVFAVGGNLSEYRMDVEDTAGLLLDYRASTGSFPVHIQMSMVQQPISRMCQINGEKGQILWNGGLDVQIYDAQTKAWDKKSFESFDRGEMFSQQLRRFLDGVRGKGRAAVDLKDGAESLRIALAAKESLATGKVVEMEREACRL